MRPLSNLYTRFLPIRATIGTKDERVISLNRSVLSPHVPRLCAWVELWLAPTVRGALAGPGGEGRLAIGKKLFLKVRRGTREPVLKTEDESLGPDPHLAILSQSFPFTSLGYLWEWFFG